MPGKDLYLFVAKKYGRVKRGAHNTSIVLKNEFPEYVEYKEDNQIQSLLDLNYRKIILVTQVPHIYSFPVNFLTLHKCNHLIFIRKGYNFKSYNSCTNGFHYYRESDIKNYIPMVTNVTASTPKEERYGFYNRPYLNPKACNWFIDRFKDNDDPIITMGVKPDLGDRGNWIHTYDNKLFWSSVTTYYYPYSDEYRDPFPTSLFEAVSLDKRVVIPKLSDRNFKDGVDDIMDVMDYDRKLLKFENFKNFYKRLFENGFENNFDRKKYNDWSSWIIGEL